jgi:hypothetical protein
MPAPCIIEKRRPAPSPLRHERLDPLRRAGVGGAGQQLGGPHRLGKRPRPCYSKLRDHNKMMIHSNV